MIAKAVRMLKTTIDTEQQNVRNTMLAVTGVSIQNSFVKGEVVALSLEAIKSKYLPPEGVKGLPPSPHHPRSTKATRTE